MARKRNNLKRASKQKKLEKRRQEKQEKIKEQKEKDYSEMRTLTQQADFIYKQLYRNGQKGYSKHDYKQIAREVSDNSIDIKKEYENSIRDKIYSSETLRGYQKKSRMFIKYLKQNYPEIKDIREAKHLADSFLKTYDKATTRKAYAAALAKMYQCKAEDLTDTKNLIRKRADVTNNRQIDLSKNKNFSVEKNKDFIRFLTKTGLRHNEVNNLKTKDFKIENGKMYIKSYKSKGGKTRWSEVLGDYKPVLKFFENPKGRHGHVFPKDTTGLTKGIAQSCRRIYANAFYNQISRDLNELKKEEKIFLRADRQGEVYDRLALMEVSKNLGHSRIDVIYNSYLASDSELVEMAEMLDLAN